MTLANLVPSVAETEQSNRFAVKKSFESGVKSAPRFWSINLAKWLLKCKLEQYLAEVEQGSISNVWQEFDSPLFDDAILGSGRDVGM
ncbi:hypothetical protein CLCR_05298 [Cladophialophora carrionii]|uniref:Uncharacterized protein n=1 Tax=Cladophialophora carrionii TaxID=86049 RepID=A0A1C1CLA1_9EURO|nr:hypothetical protein CLCR_05298 [Cladophialophora carrionii]